MWGERRGSNPRHPGPQPGALPAELRPPCFAKAMIRQIAATYLYLLVIY